MTLLARFGPLVLRGLLTVGNALAVLLLIAFWVGGNHFLLHSLAVLLAVVNAVAWPCELVASFWLKSQPAGVAMSVAGAVGSIASKIFREPGKWIDDSFDAADRGEMDVPTMEFVVDKSLEKVRRDLVAEFQALKAARTPEPPVA